MPNVIRVVEFEPVPGPWTPEPFEADDGRVPFERFVNELSDFKFVALDTPTARTLQRIADALDADLRLVTRGPVEGVSLC